MWCIRQIIKSNGVIFTITNEQVRSKFNHMSSLDNMITKRRLLLLGNVIRMPC